MLAACGCSIPDDSSTPSSSKSEGTSSAAQQGGSGSGETVSGAAFNPPASVQSVSFDSGAAVQGPNCAIDVSHVSQGYAAATGVSSARLKLQVKNGDNSYNYDMPNDGTPVFVPMNMDNGTYTLRVMQNTSGSNYVELLSATEGVTLDSPFEPYLRPNVFCSFDDGSAVVRKAREITAGCATQGDALRAICNFIIDNVSYDTAKAERLSSSSGYVPDPDATLSSMSGICFDYASLGAAMRAASASRRASSPATSRPTTSTTPGSWSTSMAPGTRSSSPSTRANGRASTSPSPRPAAATMSATAWATKTATCINRLNDNREDALE